MNSKEYKKIITAKANNKNKIRVLYKQVGQAPEVKIINNVFRLKKEIIKKNLEIIPYQSLFIICKNKKTKLNRETNIFLPLNVITGDLIVVKINKKKREFESLSQEDVIWYSQDLINKSPKNNPNCNAKKNIIKKSQEELVLWEYYLIYAVALGVNVKIEDKIIEKYVKNIV